MRLGLPAVVASVALASTASAAPARGGAAKQCVAAHEEAQALRTQKKLHAARERYVACARAECPVVLQQECAEQIEQMQDAAPTLALEALDDKGASDPRVVVRLDGELVAERLTGAAIPVEPGEHVLRFERASDGKVLEQRVLVVEGEKNRKVVADFQALLAPPSPGADDARSPRSIPTLAWAAAGVAVAGAGSFAFFSLSGRGTEDDLAKRCAPACASEDVASVKRDYLVADVSLAVAVVATAVAAVLALPALTSPRGAAAAHGARRARLGPTPWMPTVRLVEGAR